MSKDTWPVSASSYRINWAPQTVVEEVLQNVSTILATQTGTVPYSRKLGSRPVWWIARHLFLLLWPRERLFRKSVSLNLARLSIQSVLTRRMLQMALYGRNWL